MMDKLLNVFICNQMPGCHSLPKHLKSRSRERVSGKSKFLIKRENGEDIWDPHALGIKRPNTQNLISHKKNYCEVFKCNQYQT